jgi:aspartyl aminopeptidase
LWKFIENRYTWFDRDLTVAGRVIVATKGEKNFEHRLVHINRPILRIPSLAIHLQREVKDSFKFNNETHLVPILSTEIQSQLGKEESNLNHHSVLLELLAEQLNCKASAIKDFELSVVDTQPGAIGGAQQEFIFSPRLDNLLSTFTALDAFVESVDSAKNDTDVRLVCFFDHEEIGSQSMHGAGSALMKDTILRINQLFTTEETPKDAYATCISKSFIISSDMAHAVHPNYAEKHESNHKPQMHKGPVIKVNANQRYATNAVTSFLIKQVANKAGVPLQEYVVRNDSGCGSTIGPILSSNCGIRTIDLGNPQLSMHSIRETCGTVDLVYARDLFMAFFNHFREIDDNFNMDAQ